MTTHTLPQGWEIKRLGDIIDIQGGSQPPKSEFIYEPKDGYIQLLQIRDFGENGVPTFVPKNRVTKFCNEDDILIARYGASLGRIVTGLSGAYNVALAKTIFDEKILAKRFVYYLLQTQIFQVPLTMISRSAQNGFAKHEIAHIEIPVPPLQTQIAIVNKIESLFADIDAGIDSLKNAQMQLKQYRQSLLKNAFNGELTKDWREQNAEQLPSESELLAQIQTAREAHHAKQLSDWQNAVKEWEQAGKVGKKPSKPKAQMQAVQFEENFADLPNGWLNFSLDNLAEISGGLTKNAKRNSFEEKFPYLRVANVYANELKLDDVETIGIQESEKERTLLKKDDLLIVEGNGSIEQIGRVAIWNGVINPCYHQNHLIKARCYPFALPKFVLYFLMSPIGRQGIINVASSTTGLHTLSLTKVANLIVPICSFAEQTQIVAILEQKLTACDTLATELEMQLKQAELLKQSVLKAAFSGKLAINKGGDK